MFCLLPFEGYGLVLPDGQQLRDMGTKLGVYKLQPYVSPCMWAEPTNMHYVSHHTCLNATHRHNVVIHQTICICVVQVFF